MVGILSGYLASYLLIEEVGGWRWMYGVSVFPAVALGAGVVSHLSSHTVKALQTLSLFYAEHCCSNSSGIAVQRHACGRPRLSGVCTLQRCLSSS